MLFLKTNHSNIFFGWGSDHSNDTNFSWSRCTEPLCLRLRSLLVQGQTKRKQSLLSQAWCSLNEDTIDFLISNGVVANVMSESSCCFYIWQKLRMQRVCVEHFILRIHIHCCQLNKSVSSHGSLLLLFVMMFMVWHVVRTLIRLWLHYSCHASSGFAGTDRTVPFDVVVEIHWQSHSYLPLECTFLSCLLCVLILIRKRTSGFDMAPPGANVVTATTIPGTQSLDASVLAG